jgi:hypothetical protein
VIALSAKKKTLEGSKCKARGYMGTLGYRTGLNMNE